MCADPRYISPTTKMYHDIVAAHGQLISGGINFAAKLLSHHSSPWMYIPYAILVIGAVGLQYLQMARLNARNPQANQANPQAAMLQKYMPLIFGFIYLNVAAILNVYFIVSSAIRIGTQEVLFRRGIVPGPGPGPRRRPAASRGTLSAAKDAGVGDDGAGTPEGEGNGSGSTEGGAKGKTASRRATGRSRRPTGAPTDRRTARTRRMQPRSTPGRRPKKRERRADTWSGWKQAVSPSPRRRRRCSTCSGSPRTTRSSSS